MRPVLQVGGRRFFTAYTRHGTTLVFRRLLTLKAEHVRHFNSSLFVCVSREFSETQVPRFPTDHVLLRRSLDARTEDDHEEHLEAFDRVHRMRHTRRHDDRLSGPKRVLFSGDRDLAASVQSDDQRVSLRFVRE